MFTKVQRNLSTDNSLGKDTDNYSDDPVANLRGLRYNVCVRLSDPVVDADKVINIASGEGKKPIN